MLSYRHLNVIIYPNNQIRTETHTHTRTQIHKHTYTHKLSHYINGIYPLFSCVSSFERSVYTMLMMMECVNSIRYLHNKIDVMNVYGDMALKILFTVARPQLPPSSGTIHIILQFFCQFFMIIPNFISFFPVKY